MRPESALQSARRAGRWLTWLLLLPAAHAAAPGATVSSGLQYQTVTAADGMPLSLIIAGPPVRQGILFLHGFSLAAEAFELQLTSELADQWRLVAFDLRGHGGSGKPWDPAAYRNSASWADDVETVRQAAGLDQMVLVGWSYGGIVAMDYLRHYGQDHVAAVELVGSLARLLPMEQLQYDAQHMAQGAANAAQAVRPELAARAAAADEFADRLTAGTIPAALHQQLILMPLLLPPYAREAMMSRTLDNTDLRERISVPLRISNGTSDALVPAAGVRLLLESIPTAEAVSYPGLGHAPFLEASELYNRNLAEFARLHLPPFIAGSATVQ